MIASRIGRALLLVVTFTVFAAGSRAAAAARPNIIVILADDMGFSDIGCYGSEIATPNIDKLAAGGLRFTQFYNMARCCPTRAALLTGLYPHQVGIGHMIDPYAAAIRAKLDSPAYTTKLNDRCLTVAEALSTGGYQTFMTGKWHVGGQREAWPDRRGFGRSFVVIKGAMNYFGSGAQLDAGETKMELALDDAPYEIPEGFYATDAFSDYGARFIRERDAGRPFFLYLAYNAPHWPLHALPQDIAKYRGKYKEGFAAIRERRLKKQRQVLGQDWALSPRDPKANDWDELTPEVQDDRDLRMAIYAAQVDRMDQGIGRVLAVLHEAGIERNTVVPATRENVFSTMQDGQRAVEFKIYQGESRRVADNVHLGRIMIDGVRM